MSQRKVYLHGALAKKWGKQPFLVDADTTQLVMQGLFVQLGAKFKQTIKEGKWHVLKGKPKAKNDLGPEEVQFKLGEKVMELHIMPAIEGAGAVFRVVLGVILVVGGFVFGQSWAIQLGASMILGGVAQLLAPKPQMSKPSDQAGQQASFMFNGTVNVTEQGGPVPIIYGRVPRASCVVLSAGLTVENLPL